MPRFRVAVVQTAAYSTYEVALQAESPEDACRRAIAHVASGDAGEGRFVHTGSAPDDVRPPYAVEVLQVKPGNPIGLVRTFPFDASEIGAQFPQVAKLLAAAQEVSRATQAKPGSLEEVARGVDLALNGLEEALAGFADHV